MSELKLKGKEGRLGDRPPYNVICTTLLIEKSPQALPLGAACIASAIKNDKKTKNLCSVDMKVFSLEDENLNNQKLTDKDRAEIIAEAILESKPDIVALSVFVWNRNILEFVGTDLQKNGVVCIAGGPEVTANPKSFKCFDYLICGEGEISVPKIIQTIINGTADQINNPIIYYSEPATDFVTSPYLDGTLDPSHYEGALWELARGCPFKCSYCYESKGEKKVRQIPMERIQKELDLFAIKKIPQVFVLDPTYNANKERAKMLLNMIAKKTPDTFYYFEARAEFIDLDLANAFTKIPCALQIGLQSANENVLRLVNRPFNRKQFVKNIGYLNKAGVIFGLDLIYGLPGETFSSFCEGIDFAISLYPNNLEIFCLSVLPGTDLYDRASELKLVFQQKPPYHITRTDAFSEEDMLKASKLALACNIFYNQGRSVPWFVPLCKSMHMRPSVFFKLFARFMEQNGMCADDFCKKNHKDIEKIQIDFVKEIINKNNKRNLELLIVDLIKFNGALARTQESGKGEIVKLNYDSEYLASQYATDFEFFVKNVRKKTCTIQTFKRKGFADWK